MIYVHNLASEDRAHEYEFPDSARAEWAVCYAYASENNLLSLLFSTLGTGTDLSDVFPLVLGKDYISCGDYVVRR